MKKKVTGKEDLVQVNVKLIAGTDKQATFDTLRVAPGVINVTQTFPDEVDEELATLYLLDVKSSKVKPVLRRLRANPEIEYVEEAASRKLIR
ncbi:MAG: hypothetical protein A3K41_06125 [Chloroflexi bacterium RIFOXYD12_FULL_57_15]|nr:MAG: hypothetical protein A3K41_06125 [Chloroflexi bacterium RIFOXYD12_FULL_57_15]